MIDTIDAVAFSHAWAAAWNRRDVEWVLQHFHEDAVFLSPVARQIGFADDGLVKGKEALRRYWVAALTRNPDLHFHVTAVYEGIDSIVIAFRTQKGVDRVEVLRFRQGLVVEGHGTFAAS